MSNFCKIKRLKAKREAAWRFSVLVQGALMPHGRGIECSEQGKHGGKTALWRV
ncbi:hypothetical protein AcetOrient_orf03730 [Acetobacter orientalis]|uniref:Uncharacterized protein n=1 Tax=Acetobacter orientalis TaxID=146474 RepID=A0A2Z5ZK89_9PROT|nr:hypothetical protein AcetOrient_orf03730 [Acetobacter orientalis]